MTQSVTVRQVNQQTSSIFQRVRDGEELIVTRAGRPQARIIPFHPKDRYEELVADGRIVPAETNNYQPDKVFTCLVDVDALLEADRGEREL